MVFEVPESKRSLDQNVFKFTFPGDRAVYKIPKLQYLRPSLIEQIEGGSKVAAVRAVTNEYAPGLFERFEDSEQLAAFYEAWAKASGISLGESSGSAESSQDTEEPSAETSSE